MSVNLPSPQQQLPKGALVGDTYRVLRLLGQGTMGLVSLAWDERLERNVAIKLVRAELLSNATLRERFLTEARAMARVNHRNVLQIYAFGEHEGAPYFVMEYVPGKTVQDWITEHQGAPPDLTQTARILDEICQGVAAIHAAHTVHRDLKPSNILIGLNFRVAVADLGLAHVLEQTTGPKNKLAFEGTLAYMAPEVVLQRAVAPELIPRVDVYSVACIAHELLTGKLPAEAGHSYLEETQGFSDLIPPSTLRPELPVAMDAVLLQALAKDPSQRTPSVAAFREDILSVLETGGLSARPTRILVAEDDEDFRFVLGLALQQEFPDAEVECCEDGAAALAAFDRHPASVAVIDLRMPHLDGIELTALLRVRDAARSMPIIVLTASGGASEWQRLSMLGADGFLVKPVNLADVITLVRRALGDRSRSLLPSLSALG